MKIICFITYKILLPMNGKKLSSLTNWILINPHYHKNRNIRTVISANATHNTTFFGLLNRILCMYKQLESYTQLFYLIVTTYWLRRI